MPTVYDDMAAGEPPVFVGDLPNQPYWPRRGGRKANKCQGFRYVQTGKAGQKLEAVKTPAGLITTRAAVFRFFAALTGGPAAARPTTTTRAGRERRQSAAERDLAADGIGAAA